MDKEQIIKALECCTRKGCSMATNADCPFIDDEFCATTLPHYALDLIKAQDITISEFRKSLEKSRIRQKPVYNCKRGALCPVCDGELYSKFLYVRRFKQQEIRINERARYCKHCGCVLDWGESEDTK